MLFDLHPMRADERDRAYVLVHLMKPDVDLARWRRFLRAAAQQRAAGIDRGIVVATPDGTCLVGLYTWIVQPSLDHERIFSVDNFIATGALDPEPLFQAMIDRISTQAHELHCGAIEVSLPSIYTATRQQRLLVDSFLGQGFAVEDQKLLRTCAPAASAPRKQGGAPGTEVPDALH